MVNVFKLLVFLLLLNLLFLDLLHGLPLVERRPGRTGLQHSAAYTTDAPFALVLLADIFGVEVGLHIAEGVFGALDGNDGGEPVEVDGLPLGSFEVAA